MQFGRFTCEKLFKNKYDIIPIHALAHAIGRILAIRFFSSQYSSNSMVGTERFDTQLPTCGIRVRFAEVAELRNNKIDANHAGNKQTTPILVSIPARI